MSDIHRLSRPPALLPSMASGLLRSRSGVPAEPSALPGTTLRLDGVGFDAGRVAAYRACCGFDASSEVPSTFPFVAAFPLQLALLTRPEWPLRPAGLVHLGMSIRQWRPTPVGSEFVLTCRPDNAQFTSRGLEFDLVAEFADGEGRAWTGTSRILFRRRNLGPRQDRAQEESTGGMTPVGTVVAATGTGRAYARVSGDWNPIHLGWAGARLFGFARPVAHGMWTLARTLAVIGGSSTAVDATFRAPLYLPGRMQVHVAAARRSTRRFLGLHSESHGIILSGSAGSVED